MNTEKKKRLEKLFELMSSHPDIHTKQPPIAIWDEEIDDAVIMFLTKEGYEEMDKFDWGSHPYEFDDDKVAMRMNPEEFADLVVSFRRLH